MSTSPNAPVPSPSGTWPSPISPASLVSGATGISEAIPDADGSVWWAESRPGEGGRTAIMRHLDGLAEEITPPDANVRTTVHEYGGGAWWAEGGTLWYVDYADQRLRQLTPGDTPRLLSPVPKTPGALRFADFRPTQDGRWLIGVCEQHSGGAADAEELPTSTEPRNVLFALATDGSERLVTLAEGADFYGSPRLSPDARQLAWIEWNHPNMPWDDTTLAAARLDTSAETPCIGSARQVAGGDSAGEAIVQPEWSPDGTLHFISDRRDAWWLYREGQESPVVQCAGEIGYPPWVFGLSRYAFRSDGTVLAARFERAIEILDGYPDYTAFYTLRVAGDHVAFVAGGWSAESTVILDGQVVRPPRELGLDAAYLAPPERITFPSGKYSGRTTAEGHSGSLSEAGNAAARAGQPTCDTTLDEPSVEAHALYFAPASPTHCTPSNERPPLVVLVHGGPTSAARSMLNLARRFWTSRGFAVADVNYRGSSGFGRAYRKQLESEWGVADVEDCVACARFLAERGDVDPERLIIRGGSAGGFTVLAALAFHDTFTCGASLYGIADLEALAADTHKFESRYTDSLVGELPRYQARYVERSPIHHLEGFTAPMIVLQGSEDKVVPPNQSRMIVDALTQRGVPVAYLEFEGEQHGFRKADTIITAYEAELEFYGRIFGFAPAPATDGRPPSSPLLIANLDDACGTTQ